MIRQDSSSSSARKPPDPDALGALVASALGAGAILAALLSGPGCGSGASSSATTATPGNPHATLATASTTTSVLQYHGDIARSGAYVTPGITRANVASARPLPGFSSQVAGPVHAQPLYLPGGARDILVVATEQNVVVGLDAMTGTQLWSASLGTPVALADLPCGNLDPLGVTGTPAIDAASRTIYVDAMTTPDGGTTKKHKVFALSADDGSVKPGWPLDLESALAARGVSFDSTYNNQRGALLLIGGTVYVPFGGHDGDCGTYHGTVVGISASSPTITSTYVTPGDKAGIWTPGGLSSAGGFLYAGTGNTEGATTWAGGEAVLRLKPDLTLVDYFAPSDWQSLDQTDRDIGSTNPIPLTVSGGSPSSLVVEFGKNGMGYLLNANSLGGIGGQASSTSLSAVSIIGSPATFTSAQGTFVALKANASTCPAGQSGDFTMLKIVPASPPSIQTAWCGSQNGTGSPMLTSPDGVNDWIAWGLGAEGDGELHAWNAETGAPLFSSPALGSISRYQTPIAIKNRVYVATDSGVQAFEVPSGP